MADDLAHHAEELSCSDGDRLSVQSFPKGRIIVGRSPDNEIYIKSKFVSRHHAQIVTDDEGCIIEDLNSTNGVFIGERQVKKHRLRSGDVVTLGVHDLVYTDLRKEETAAAMEDARRRPAGRRRRGLSRRRVIV